MGSTPETNSDGTATEQFRAMLARRIALAMEEDEQAHIGHAYWQVTEAEIEVFMLPPRTAAKLWIIWDTYFDAVVQTADAEPGSPFARLRSEQPFLDKAMRGGDKGYDSPYISAESFAEFGAIFGIDRRSCNAWFWKWSFMDRRMDEAAKRRKEKGADYSAPASTIRNSLSS